MPEAAREIEVRQPPGDPHAQAACSGQPPPPPPPPPHPSIYLGVHDSVGTVSRYALVGRARKWREAWCLRPYGKSR